MESWVIGDVVKSLAMEWPGADDTKTHYKTRQEVDAAIISDIQTLADLGFITLCDAKTGKTIPNGSPINGDSILTRKDLESVSHYVRRSGEEKKAFLEEVAIPRKTGRYTLKQAADRLEAEAGERFEAILIRLKQAVRNNELDDMPGHNQQLAYGPEFGKASCVRDFYEEAYWDDLNAWLDQHEPRIGWRFPSPVALKASDRHDQVPSKDVRDGSIEQAHNMRQVSGNHATTPATLLVEDMIRKMEGNGQRVTTTTLWLELLRATAELPFLDQNLNGLLVNAGTGDSKRLTKAAVRGILTRYRKRKK